MSKVFVSGANGYIAQHLIKELISKGYKVIGSVRNHEKGDKLIANIPELQIEVVSDVLKPGAFDVALEKNPEIIGFFHTLSPVVFKVDDFEKDIILPAVEGTKNVLDSVHRLCPNVKRFVYTSSMSAVWPSKPTGEMITEETWCDLGREDAHNAPDAYLISKTWAEKAVWEFMQEKSPNFTANSVNPTYVFGPQAFDADVKETLNFSAELVNMLIKLKPDDPVPTKSGGFIDVRDVAKAHIFAFETETDGLRLLLCELFQSSQIILDIIHKHFPGLKLPVGEPGGGPKDPQNVDNSKSKSLLKPFMGPFMGLEESIVDSIDQIVKHHKDFN